MQENRGKIEFLYETGNGGRVVMTLDPEASLTEALEGFETFLKAVGYSFNGIVDIVDQNYSPCDPNAEQN